MVPKARHWESLIWEHESLSHADPVDAGPHPISVSRQRLITLLRK